MASGVNAGQGATGGSDRCVAVAAALVGRLAAHGRPGAP